jgi:hypothetical protein
MSELQLSPFATRLDLHFDPPVGPPECAARLRALLNELARIQSRIPGAVVGHIKVFAELPGGGYLRGSAVGPGQDADIEVVAEAGAPIAALALDLNVLVYGCTAADCRDHVREVLAEDSSAARRTK